MNYCSQCGAEVTLRIPEGDTLPRYVCDACGTIHYSNPKIVAGCIAEWEGRILMCKRAIEPRYGLWTLPAGFMENGETTLQAAARESREEACAEVADLSLYGMFNLPHINQVYLLYRGRLIDGRAEAGAESLEVKLCTEQDIPWQSLAFPVMHETLISYYEDCKRGSFAVHTADLLRMPDRTFTVVRY
jgi:ADP-ribose pyrophosphatase YjhB (NUDIX family)